MQPVAPRHRRGARRRIQALGHDPRLLLQAPAAPPANPGDHFRPAEAVAVRTSRSTMITHRSRPAPILSGPLSSPPSAGTQGAAQTTVTLRPGSRCATAPTPRLASRPRPGPCPGRPKEADRRRIGGCYGLGRSVAASVIADSGNKFGLSRPLDLRLVRM